MNAEEALQNAVNNPDFLVISGSRLYGTHRENSDFDYRGFVIPPFEYIVGLKHFDDTDIQGADHKVYSLKRFIDLVMAGDPQNTENLFVPEDKIINKTHIGQIILDNRDSFLSKKIYYRISGYSYSEFRKAMGVKLEIAGRTKKEDDVILDIRNLFSPDKAEMDEIIDILMSKKEKKLVSSLGNIGEKRKKDFEKYGFGVSSAAHAIRLCEELKELLLRGNITFPRSNASFLKDIRYGRVSKEEVTKIYENALSEAKEAYEKSILPEKPDSKKIYNIYSNLIKDFLLHDVRFLSK